MSPSSIKIWFVLLSVTLSLMAAVIMAEFSLGVMEKRQRKSLLDYADTVGPQGLGRGGYLRENFKAYVTDGVGGKVRWVTNSAGFRSDQEFSEEPPPGVLRLLSLGDSFTAGYRVGQEETFSYLLQQWIKQKFGKSEILVAEIEEPATGLYYLDRFGIKFNPHLVLLGITLGNDIAQAYHSLDGEEKYVLSLKDGKVRIDLADHGQVHWAQDLRAYKIPAEYLQPRNPVAKFLAPARRWLGKRQVVRRLYPHEEPITSSGNRDNPELFDLNNGLGMYTNPAAPEIDEAYRCLFRILEAFQVYCEQRQIVFAIQLFPQRFQIQPEDWERAVAACGLERSRFDLMAPNKRIQAFCREQGIFCFDPTAAMAQYYAQTKENLYKPRGDMHWNREGHWVFFECSREFFAVLVPKGLEAAKARNVWLLPAQARSHPQ